MVKYPAKNIVRNEPKFLRVKAKPPAQRIKDMLRRAGKHIEGFDVQAEFELAMRISKWAAALSTQYDLKPQNNILSDRIFIAETLTHYAKADRATYLAALLYPPFVDLVKPPPYDEENPDHLKALVEQFGEDKALGRQVAQIIRRAIVLRRMKLLPPAYEITPTSPPRQSDEERQERFLMMALFEAAKEPPALLILQMEMQARVKSLHAVTNPERRARLIENIKNVQLPLASMAGFWLLRNAMADSVLKFEAPHIYKAIKNFRSAYIKGFADDARHTSHQDVLEKLKSGIEYALISSEGDESIGFRKEDIKVDVRLKSIESIYKKLDKKGVFKELEKQGIPKEQWGEEITKILKSGKHIHDFFGARVTLSDAYIKRKAKQLFEDGGTRSLGHAMRLVKARESVRVHTMLRDRPLDAACEFESDAERYKDYVSSKKENPSALGPKENGYSAVHGTYRVVELGTDKPGPPSFLGEIEIQSGSASMFHVNEYGTATHESYKAKGSQKKAPDMTRQWKLALRKASAKRLPHEYAANQIPFDSSDKEDAAGLIAVYTANGDIVFLREQSTGADFAAKVKVIATTVGVSDIQRINPFEEMVAVQDGVVTPMRPDAKDVATTSIRLQNGDSINLVLDRSVLSGQADDAQRREILLAALTNSGAKIEVKRYFRKLANSPVVPTGPR